MTEQGSKAQGVRGGYAKGLARRQAILDSAIAVFARRGADRTSLRAIAEEVGVTHAALTHHFGSLEQLLVEVYRESARQLEQQHPTPEAASPVERMRLASQKNRGVPGLVQLYTSLVATAIEEGHPAATAFATERFADIRASLTKDIRACQRNGDLRPDLVPEQVAALVIAASDGLQIQWLLDDAVDQEGALAMLDRLLAGPARD